MEQVKCRCCGITQAEALTRRQMFSIHASHQSTFSHLVQIRVVLNSTDCILSLSYAAEETVAQHTYSRAQQAEAEQVWWHLGQCCHINMFDSSLFTGLPWWPGWQGILLQYRRPGWTPWVGKMPWSREWLSTPVFWSGEFHGQRNLAGYSPWVHKVLDTTE